MHRRHLQVAGRCHHSELPDLPLHRREQLLIAMPRSCVSHRPAALAGRFVLVAAAPRPSSTLFSNFKYRPRVKERALIETAMALLRVGALRMHAQSPANASEEGCLMTARRWLEQINWILCCIAVG